MSDIERKIAELSVLYEISSIPTVGITESKILDIAIDKTLELLEVRNVQFFFMIKRKKLLFQKQTLDSESVG